MSLSVRPPVFPDRIKIRGWQWCEPVDANNCNLCTKMEISCKIPAPGVGVQVEKGTLSGMKGAYADQPRRVLTYLAERRAANRPYDARRTDPNPRPDPIPRPTSVARIPTRNPQASCIIHLM